MFLRFGLRGHPETPAYPLYAMPSRSGNRRKTTARGAAASRVAPVGLVAVRDDAFQLGCETAALTHGHPSGVLSAGFLALLIAEIRAGVSLQGAIRAAKAALIKCANHTEVLRAVENTEALAVSPATTPIPESLGQGWVAEEALAIALYCALVASNFEEAVALASESCAWPRAIPTSGSKRPASRPLNCRPVPTPVCARS